LSALRDGGAGHGPAGVDHVAAGGVLVFQRIVAGHGKNPPFSIYSIIAKKFLFEKRGDEADAPAFSPVST
jgi:hypothetical protein